MDFVAVSESNRHKRRPAYRLIYSSRTNDLKANIYETYYGTE